MSPVLDIMQISFARGLLPEPGPDFTEVLAAMETEDGSRGEEPNDQNLPAV